MFRPNRLFTLLFASALLALATHSPAETLSRKRAVVQALRQNPQISAARARRAQSEAEKTQADSARWPIVTLEVGIGPALRAERVPGTAVDSTRSRYDVRFDDLSVVFGGQLNVVQPLYTFGKIDSFRDAATHGIRARDAQTRMTQADVAVEVARLYETLLFARDATRFFEEIENYIARTIVATEDRIKAGAQDLSDQDVLRLQAALAAVRLSLHHTRTGQEQARAGLVAYLGLAVDTPIEPREQQLTAIHPPRSSSPRLVADALSRRPELNALAQGAEAYDSLAAAEQAGALPDVFVMAFATGAYTPGRDLVESRYVIDPLYHFDPGVLLGMRWQIQGATASGRANQRRAQARELRHLRSWAMAGVPAQVEKASADVERARLDMADAHEGAERAKKWLIKVNADYVVGLADSLAIVDSTRAYVELRAAELDATFRHNVAMAELAHATGTLVDDALGLYPGTESP